MALCSAITELAIATDQSVPGGGLVLPPSTTVSESRFGPPSAVVELEKIARYASEDADITLRLSNLFAQQLEEVPQIKKLHDEVEVPLIEVLAEMEWNGIAIHSAQRSAFVRWEWLFSWALRFIRG